VRLVCPLSSVPRRGGGRCRRGLLGAWRVERQDRRCLLRRVGRELHLEQRRAGAGLALVASRGPARRGDEDERQVGPARRLRSFVAAAAFAAAAAADPAACTGGLDGSDQGGRPFPSLSRQLVRIV